MAEHAARDPHIESALAYLRGHSTADLRFDEHMREIKYVIHTDGRPIAPVMVAMINAVDTVLYIPGYTDEAMEVLVTLEQFDERGQAGAAADRWRIYHGEPPDVRWAFMAVDSARFKGIVIDGEALQQPNPLASDEGRICRTMNQDHADVLRMVCAKHANFNIEQPVMVGIDPQGIDVRARFDVVRVPSVRPMRSADEALSTLKSMARD